MRIHVKMIALFHILLGMVLGTLFLLGHYHFFSVSSTYLPENSVTSDASFFERLSDSFNIYMDFFAQYDINPLISLLTIIISIAFGYGLLKLKSWARKLGFVIIAVSAFSSIFGIFTVYVSATSITQLGLAAYMWWIFTSEETKNQFEKLTSKVP